MKTSAFLPRATRFILLLAATLTAMGPDLQADPARRRAAPEPRPNVLDRIGDFFYTLSNGLERSDIPRSPGRVPSIITRYRVVPSKPSANHGAKKPAPADVYASNRFGSAFRPSSPSAVITDMSPPSERMVPPPAPLPDLAAVSRDRRFAESFNPEPAYQANPASDAVKSPAQPREEIKEHPVATQTVKRGRVKSPFPPYTELDVTGLPTGSLARDPVTGKVFRLP